LVDASSFECEVAKSVVTAIEAKLPDLRLAVLWASADGVVKRIQSLANDLAQQIRHYKRTEQRDRAPGRGR
jgi:hypothetical protein